MTADTQRRIQAQQNFDVVIIGAGSGGIAAASSLLKRNGGLRIALVDPRESALLSTRLDDGWWRRIH